MVDGSDSTPGVVDASPVSENRKPFPLGAYIAGGGSVLNGAYAASIGVRYRLSSHFLVGVDGEYNPWFSLHDMGDVRPGSTNVYATGFRANEYLWPMEVRGRGGVRVEELWAKDGPRAYLGAI